MKKFLVGFVFGVLILFSIKYFLFDKDKTTLQQSSVLIQQQLKNVGKLVVTEGHFSEVFNYKNSKEIFGQYFTANKKALVVVNTDVTIAYDLSKLTYEVDELNKTLRILSIPKEEISINPDFEYYDIQADYLNPFEAADYNNIKETVKKSLEKRIENSKLKNNAKTRLLSELSKFYILTNSLGWKLEYNTATITNFEDFQKIKM